MEVYLEKYAPFFLFLFIYDRSNDFKDFVAKCLAKQPGDRPSAENLLKVNSCYCNCKLQISYKFSYKFPLIFL